MSTAPTAGIPHEDDNDDLVFVLESEPDGWDPATSTLAVQAPAPDPASALPAPVPAQQVQSQAAPVQQAPTQASAHPWSDGVPVPVPAPPAPAAAAPAPAPHPSQHVPTLNPPMLGADAASHASIIHRGGVYEITLDGLRLASEVNIVLATNRLANEALRRRTRIIANVKDLRSRYYRQFNADGTYDDVAPPVPPEANLGVPFHANSDLSYQPDGGAAQEEWVADNILIDEQEIEAPAVDSGFLASLRDRLRRA